MSLFSVSATGEVKLGVRLSRAGLPLFLGLLALAPAVARGEDPLLVRLDRALDALSTSVEARTTTATRSAVAPTELASVLTEMDRREARRQRGFALTAARELPPKARERLSRVQQAYGEGQGRLLNLLRRLRGGLPAAEQADTLREAREILARIRESARGEPWSAELKVRAPRLQAPPLPAGTPPGRRAAPASANARSPMGSRYASSS